MTAPAELGELILSLDASRVAARARTSALDAWAGELEDLATLLLAGIDLPGLVAGAHPAAAGAILTRLEHRVGILVGQALELGALAATAVIAADVDEVHRLEALLGQTDPMPAPTAITFAASATIAPADVATLGGNHGAAIFPQIGTGVAAAVRAAMLATLLELGLDVVNTPGVRLGIDRAVTGGYDADTDAPAPVTIEVTFDLRIADDVAVADDLVDEAIAALGAATFAAVAELLTGELDLGEDADLVEFDYAGSGTAGDEVIGA